MKRGPHWLNREPQTSYDVVLGLLAHMTRFCRLQGDLANHYRWKQTLREAAAARPDPRQRSLLL